LSTVASVKPDIPVGVARAEAQGVLGPVNWANVFYFGVGSFDPAHLNDVINCVGIYVKSFYHDALTSSYFTPDWHFSRTKIVFRDAADSHYRSVYVSDVQGTQGAEIEAGQACYLINWVTNDPRKGGKPRTYVCGVNDDNLTDSVHVSSAIATAFNAGIATWLAAGPTASSGTCTGLALLEMSFRNGKTWRDTAASWPIRAGALNGVIATQRRRVNRLRF